MTQTRQILEHLKAYHSITPLDALRLYGCMRLGARIYDLKRMGYDITTRLVNDFNRFGEPIHYAEYHLEEAA